MRVHIRSRHGGWSKDCIWIRSSLTMPPVDGDMKLLTVFWRLAGAGDAPRPPLRLAPIASISSMNPMAPPSLRAALRSALKNDRIFAAVIPNHIDWNAGADTNRNGTPACFAMAFARYVLPVP